MWGIGIRGDYGIPRNSPPIAIQILVPTPGAQQCPARAGSHVFDIGVHCIHGTAALIPVVTVNETMMNQTKFRVQPVANLSKVTANAVFVQPMEVSVTVAREFNRRRKLERSDGEEMARSQLCFPSPTCVTRAVVKASVVNIVSCWTKVQLAIAIYVFI